MLTDNFNRQIRYLRVSVTDLCNLNCRYCNPIRKKDFLDHDQILSFEEIIRFVRLSTELGIEKLRISGGEPLFRRGVESLIRFSSELNLKYKAITTNGILLDRFLKILKESSFNAINISLDTLQKDKFKFITGSDKFEQVYSNILKAVDQGFRVKINCVVIKGINDDEIINMAELSKNIPLDVRFIELMPFSNSKLLKPLNALSIMDKIKEIGDFDEVKRKDTDGPAERIRFKGFKGETGIIGSLSMHFCSECNRIRLTSDGSIIPCLLSTEKISIKSCLRNKELDDEELKKIIIQSVKKKPKGHNYNINSGKYVKSAMIKIGG